MRDVDPRIAAFCYRGGPDVFRSVCHRHEIWRDDPFDVDFIHEHARAVFSRLLTQATTPPGTCFGRVLLLLGESGSGKTHLMRAFRHTVHSQRVGYFVYLQLSSATNDYPRYLMSNLLDSLDQPYSDTESEKSGLMHISDALVEMPSAILRAERERLRNDQITDREVSDVVNQMADNIIEDERFSRLDLYIVRALLYLQRNEPRLKNRVLSYLRCEELSLQDRELLGGLPTRTDPERTIEAIGQIMWASQNVSLVVCLDQLEEIYNFENADLRFRRAMQAVCGLADRVPSSIFVISCLDDFYSELSRKLTRPLIDRIENSDPQPVRLDSRRTEEEIRAMIALRLQVLYDEVDAQIDENDPTFPFSVAEIKTLSQLRPRDVLNYCRNFQEKCIRVGGLVPSELVAASTTDLPIATRSTTEDDESRLFEKLDQELKRAKDAAIAPTFAAQEPIIVLEQRWNDFRTTHSAPPSDRDDQLAELLTWAFDRVSGELPTQHRFSAVARDWLVDVQREHPSEKPQHTLVGLCNRKAQGGGLGKQIAELKKAVSEQGDRLVMARSSDFPSGATTKIAKEIGEAIRDGAIKVVIEDADWRTISALREFINTVQAEPALQAWLLAEKPLTRLKSVRRILDLDVLHEPTSAAQSEPIPETSSENPVSSVTPIATAPNDSMTAVSNKASDREASPVDGLMIGDSLQRISQPVVLTPQQLVTHAAFLGGSGSGKTTLALNLIEQLLLCDVPVILLDRKGDLCGYAANDFWQMPLTGAAAERRDALREGTQVSVFTPGTPDGNPLALPLIPEGLRLATTWEQKQLAEHAAAGLAGMMGIKSSGAGAAQLAALKTAIRVISMTPASESKQTVSLDDLIEFIDERDPTLLAELGQLDPKNLDKLVQNLSTLKLNRGHLVEPAGARLDVDRFLGRRAHALSGKTQLSIISTKFLGDNPAVEFWVSQFLASLLRWTSRNPSDRLQLAVFFDEADMYLPATRSPATKPLMEDLLKRARSAGVSVMLATQSPGDLDYKCRDNIQSWFVGRVKEQRAIEKLKPMFENSPTDVASILPTQKTGEFFLVRPDQVTRFKAQASALKTEQLREDQILTLANACASST